ncbi:hypothetical protein [Aurantiacibacter gilvus]|uniref:DUF883 domain-containing protein n=1 Tax=Aurantiacibacter gilvus TaxID=3139141 RepID=A0ABU9ID58_9SPHN
MSDPKREEIKARIAAAQAREEAEQLPTRSERAKDAVSGAADSFTTFVKERPLTAAAGGLVLGILVASMFKGPRRAAMRGGAKAAGLAALGAEAATAFTSELFDDAKAAGREGARKAEDLGDAVGDTARSLRRDASYQAARTGDLARIASRETGKRLARAFGRR